MRKYYIEIWKTEEDREYGEGDVYFFEDIIPDDKLALKAETDFETALKEALKFYDNYGILSMEIIEAEVKNADELPDGGEVVFYKGPDTDDKEIIEELYYVPDKITTKLLRDPMESKYYIGIVEDLWLLAPEKIDKEALDKKNLKKRLDKVNGVKISNKDFAKYEEVLKTDSLDSLADYLSEIRTDEERIKALAVGLIGNITKEKEKTDRNVDMEQRSV